MNLDWLVIGGGIHGVHVAARLIGEAKVDPDKIRIVDPGERLLERWRNCTETTGMTHLRSPSVHNLDLNPWSLIRYAGKRKNRKAGLFAPPYNRPNLGFFNDHCDTVIGTFGLSDLHIRARALSCTVDCDGVAVGLCTGTEITTANVVLAMGSGDQPQWPEWAPREDPRVQHVFGADFDGWPSTPETVVVVGGGISAGQVALRLVEDGNEVHMVSRHALREHQFDSDSGWLGPRLMAGFDRVQDVDQRRAMISDARHKGSVSPDIRRALLGLMKREKARWHEAEVEGLVEHDSGFELSLTTGAVVEAQRVLLATGFEGHRPGGAMVDQLIESASLPCARCGYPIVDKALRWHPRVYVTGPLAELELGPISRNIAGARRAADRLVAVARSGNSSAAMSAS